MSMKSPSLIILLAALFCLPPFAAAQTATCKLFGTVYDPQKLLLPGVAVQIKETRTGFTRGAISNDDGRYEFLGLQPGDYEVTWELSSFSPGKTQIKLEINQQAKLDLEMKVGTLETTVLVDTSPALVNSTDATIGTVIDQDKVQSLPLNGRHFLELTLLTPGARTSHGAQSGNMNPLYWRPGQNSAISVGGGRADQNVFLLDGTINTDPVFNSYVISLAPDVVREFQTQSGTYSAEYGSQGTGVVNVVTKTGTNSPHGSAYEFIRNSALDARDFTSPSKLPHFSQNQFGATFGGPIIKDKMFFFGHYEGFRSVQGLSMIESVPTLAARDGDFMGMNPIYDPATTRANPAYDASKPVSASNPKLIRDQFPDNMIPMSRINPITQRVVKEFVPAPNMDHSASGGGMNMGGAGGSFNNLQDNRAQRLTNDQFTARIDRNLGNQNVYGRYSLSAERGYSPENLPGFGSFHNNRVQNLTLTHNWVLSPSLVNSFRFGWQRMNLERIGEKGTEGRDLITELGITGVGFGGKDAYGLPQFVVQGYDPFGDQLLATPSQYHDTVYQFGDHIAKSTRSHSLKIGAEVRRFRWNMLGFFQNRGFYSFSPGYTTRTATNDGTGDALASFLLGLPVVKTRQAGYPSMHMRNTTIGVYLQDDWRARKNLTLNLGLRYEIVTNPNEATKPMSNMDFVNGLPVVYISGENGYSSGAAYTDKNNIAPRLGIAYTPWNDRFVVRGGYGLFFGQGDMNSWCNLVHNVPIVFPETQQSDNFTPAISTIGFDPAILGKTVVSFTGVDPRGRSAYTQQYSLTLEGQITKNDLVQAGYAGSVSKKLQRAHLLNNALPGAGAVGPRRPFKTASILPGTDLSSDFIIFPIQSTTFPISAINIIENTANSTYDSGWILYKHQFSHGLSILTNYTFSRLLTDAPAFRSPANEPEIPQNNYDLKSEWGLGGCDLRQRYVLSAQYLVPIKAGSEWMGNRVLSSILGDWNIATIFQAQSGFPFTISVFGDTANAGTILNTNPIRANQVAGTPIYLPAEQRSGDRWFNTAAFAAPAAFQFGNVGRNTVTGPGMRTVDLALIREFPIREMHKVEFRAEFFNALNHTNFGTPNRLVNTAQFGSVTTAATPARQIQFAMRYRF
jgi:hypothetical protein